MARSKLDGTKRIADTLLVATLLDHGVDGLITSNEKDYSVFQEIATFDPLGASP